MDKLQQMDFEHALDYAYKKKAPDWSHKTKQDYKSKVKYLKQGAVSLGILDMRITEIKRFHFRNLLEKIKQTRKLTAAGYNIYREYLSSLLGELESYEIIEYNPVEKIKPKETIKTKAHRPPTKDQQLLIMNRIRDTNRPFYRFLSVLYGCTIRPKEICGLKIKHLHKLEQIFRLTPDDQSSTKTKFEREPVIPDWVLDLLMEMKLDSYPPDYYIFTTTNKAGKFLPGPKRMHSNTPTNWWRDIVKAPLAQGGLGLDIDQYGLKKLSGDDMVRLQRREQVDKLLEMPKAQMGHTDTQMTEVYVEEHHEIIKEMIKRKMPVL